MAATAQQAQAQSITLKGSTDIVSEFFFYSINSVLYMRGVYPHDQFRMVNQYGLKMLVTTEPALLKYLEAVNQQLKEWILNKAVQKLVLVISSVTTREPLERWQFDLQVEAEVDTNGVPTKPTNKTEKDIQEEIKAIIKQITASVTFLPLLEDACSFDLLVYTNQDLAIPQSWEESDARFVKNGTELSIRSFSTSIHKVSTTISYRDSSAS